ncbi:MAG: DUF2254 domain-containing protein [Gammaproteobacteria bacterium]
MLARLRHLAALLADSFWLVPAGLVAGSALMAFTCLHLDVAGVIPESMIEGAWLYNGGPTGARTLLGAVAGSAIGVAGTVFSITIAALTLAAGQMGPRLLRNFVRDRGNQFTLGVLLGTFTYALLVLRTVRTTEEGGFTPHLSISVGILLAFGSVGVLIYFVNHVATRINVDTVIGLVGDDLQRSVRAVLPVEDEVPPATTRDLPEWPDAVPVVSTQAGYVQSVDTAALTHWAEAEGMQVRLVVRPGHYVFPHVPVAWLPHDVADAERVVGEALLLGPVRTPYADLEYAIRQLVEVAMRALSPGINDPYSAVSVVDRLGAALCDLSRVRLPSGCFAREGRTLLTLPSLDYDGLVDTMFNPLRQHGSGNAMVLIRLLETLAAVMQCEHDGERRGTLLRHAQLVLEEGERSLRAAADVADLRQRHEQLGRPQGRRAA